MSDNQIIRELETIRAKHGGVLKPRAAWKWAEKKPNSALHPKFEWDNDKAADLYRDEQARYIIRTVKVECPTGRGKPIDIRVYHSLESDRDKGDSYRHINDIRQVPAYFAELEQQYKRDVESAKAKCRQLAAIAPDKYSGDLEVLERIA